MRALVTTGDVDRPVELGDVDEPVPRPCDVLVRVEATSLNRGECRQAAAAPAGAVFGWDVVGTIQQTSPDRPELHAGARVVGLVRAGAWAEQAAVPATDVAEVPEDVSPAAAATLPVAAMTAYHALARGGLLLGRRVAATGATGGVGRFALQLAQLAGAHTTAIVSAPDRTEGLVDVDAVEVGLDGDGDPFDLILESVGGPLLAAAVQRIRPGGQIISYGMSSEEATSLSARGLYRRNAASISGLLLFDELVGFGGGAATLARLLALVADGSLDPGVSTVADWHDAASVVQRLLGREIAGKAVLSMIYS